MDPNPPSPPSTDLVIDTITPTILLTNNGTVIPTNFTRITAASFYGPELGNIFFFYAIKITGNNANKQVRGLFVVPSGPEIEFENNTQDYNLYKGTYATMDDDTEEFLDYKLNLNFTNGSTLTIYCPEARQTMVPLSIDDWPVVYEISSE